MDFNTSVKLHIYNTIARTASAPSTRETAKHFGVDPSVTKAAYQDLESQRLLVLEPADTDRIRMAPPFSGIKTIHKVQIAAKTYFANCSWDAFGIAAALNKDADITSVCEDCGQVLDIQVRNDRPLAGSAVVHFAVPAAKWWQDIIHT